MTRAWIVLASLLPFAAPLAAESPQDHAAWWVANYGVVDPASDAQVARAEHVFARVAAVADKDSRRPPKLRVLRSAGGPLALALPDGTVLLTKEALALCYQDAKLGDARLAFVIGHELAHLGRDDFWHSFAAADVRAAAQERLAPMVAETSEQAWSKELQADSYGAIYMWLAGLPPSAVFSQSGSFLETWVAKVAAEAGSRPHPPPEQRAALVRTQLQSVAEQLDFFHFGVRLYQLGRYEDALILLERFKERFPGREVLNDIGLCHYQLALRALASCSPQEATRFRLPTSFDPTTLAGRPRLRSGRSACFDEGVFQQRAREASRYFEQASVKDDAYLPSRINASSVLLLLGEPASALAQAEEALKRAPRDPAGRNNKAVALFLYGQASNFDAVEPAITLLTELRTQEPQDAVSAYNLAAILNERGRTAAAQESWTEFLALEPSGPFADAARDHLGVLARASPEPPTLAGSPQSPIPLGPLTAATSRRLRGMREVSVDTGAFRGVVYSSKALRVLQIDRSVEVVESGEPSEPMTALLAAFGPPGREETAGPVRTLIYRGFAFDVLDGQVVRRVYFAP